MKSLGKKLLEAAKESDSPLAKMIVDGKYRSNPEEAEAKKGPKSFKKRNKKRSKGRFQKPGSTNKQPKGVEVAESKPEKVKTQPPS
ncbi:MAG TPA: hypothetical protein VNM22_16990 [Candidatus Limnocylindrales bacterium]|nr:hypothetical protein [Candidatus Limnocylindrales bacterium]